MQIEGLGYFAPDSVTFYGLNEDRARTQLIQHVSQMNLMLVASPKLEPEAAARRIGFRLAGPWEKPPSRAGDRVTAPPRSAIRGLNL